MKARWENEKAVHRQGAEAASRRSNRSTPRSKWRRARLRPEQGRRAEIRQTARSCRRSWRKPKRRATPRNKEDTLLRDKVTEEEIARIVARWTGIPVAKLMEGEREKLLHLEDMLHQRVIGQDEAVDKVCRGHSAQPRRHPGSRTARSVRSCSWVPPASARPSLPRRWRRRCSTTRHNMVRIDMSEYMEKYCVSPPDRRASGICRL